MDNAQGNKIYYGIMLDNAQLRHDAEESKNIFREIGDTSVAEASRIGDACKSVSGTLAKLGTAVSPVELARELYTFADRFERSIAEVATLSESVANDLGWYKREIIEMSTAIPVPADEAARALYRIVSAGHDGAAGMEVLRVSAKAAVGGVTETATAADAITSVLNAYKKGAGEAENVSDQFFTTARLGKTTLGELGQSISQAIPIAASFGIESEQVLAAIATLTKSGTPAAQAVTQVRAAIEAASEQLGDGYLKTHTFQQGLLAIADKAGGSEARLRTLVPEVEAMNGILGLTGIHARTAASNLEALSDSAGATEAAFRQVAGRTDAQLTLLKNNVLAEFSGLGESMVDNVGKVAAALNEAFDTGKVDKVISVLASLIAMYGTYKATLIAISAIERVAMLANQVREYVQMARALGLVTANQIAFNRATLLNPYVAVAAAIAAVVGGLVLYSMRTSDAERASKALGTAIDEETSRLDNAYEAINKAKEGTEQRKTALDNFNRDYGRYLDNLLTEKSTLEEVAAAYDKAKMAVVDYAIEKARESYMSEPQADADKAKAGLRNSASKWIGKLGDAGKSGAFMADVDELIRRIEGGEEFSEGALYRALGNAFTKQAGFKDNSFHGVKAKEFALEFQREARNLQTAAKEFEEFSEAYRNATQPTVVKPEKTKPEFASYAEQVKGTAETIKRLRGELADLRAGKGDVPDFAAAIEAKAKELKAEEDRYKLLLGSDERENVPPKSKYEEQIRQEAIRLQRAEEDLEFSVRQAKIDASAEGYEKTLEQNNLNHDREIKQIERQKEDTLKAIQDAERTKWEAAHPDWEKKGEEFTPDTKELPEGDEKFFDDMGDASNKKLANANQQALDDMLAEILTYEQQRTAIAEEYAKKRKALYEADGKTLRKGVTGGNVEELNRSEAEALKGVDEEYAQREETYQAWMNQIANMTLEGLEEALAKAKAALEEAEKSGTGGSELAAAKAKVNTAEEKVKKARAENEVSPGKRTIKEWEDLYGTLQEAEREFESIGDAVGGVAGEVVETAGAVMTSTLSMINGIVQLTTASKISLETTSEASAAAIKTVEKASVILAVISAAMQIATTIVGLFNNDDKYQKEIDKLQGRIDQLQWELDNADVMRLQKNSGKALEQLKRVYAETTEEVLKLHAITNRYDRLMYELFGRGAHQNEILEKSAEKLAVAYANIEYSASKALGSDKYDEAKEQLRNIAEQQLLMQEQIRKEEAKKETDPGKIKDWERQIEELRNEASNLINDLVEDIVGGSATDIAQELGDAFMDAFRSGEDAAEAWGGKVKDIVADIVKRMLVQELLEKPLATLLDDFKGQWFGEDGTFLGFDAVNDSMVDFAAALNALILQYGEGLDELPEELQNLLFGDADAAREASEKGIATASQESVDELNGRATAIQGHTYSIMESSRMLVVHSAFILQHLAGIETNTKQLARLEHIESDMKAVKSTVNDIAMKGLKLRN